MRSARVIVSLTWSAVLASCVSVDVPPSGAPLHLPAGRALVFGSVHVLDHGRSVIPPGDPIVDVLTGTASDPLVRLHLFRVEDGHKAVGVPYELDGSFRWLLEPGTYVVLHVPPSAMPRNEGLAVFQVARAGSALYAGTLELRVRSDPWSAAGPQVEYELDLVHVLDERERATAMLSKRHAGALPPIEPSLAWTDAGLATLFDDFSDARCLALLARHGLRPLTR